LLILENALAGDGTDGWIVRSDQALDGSQFPFISVGVVLSSALFIAIPSVVIFGKQAGVSRWVLPVVLVLGVSNDGVRSPLSRYGRYAAPAQLPLAAGLLTSGGDWGFQADRKSIRSELGSSFYLRHRFIRIIGGGSCFAVV